MKLPDSLQSERGVSPVIGVILMVAITVILAAVIGSFVLGIGGDIEQAPQASLTVNGGDIVHQGGDTIQGDEVEFKDGSGDPVSVDTTTDLGPGDTWTIDDTTTPDSITIVHTPSDKIIAELDV